MTEITIDTTTRLLYIKGETTIDHAFLNDGKTFDVNDRRVVYTARLEIVDSDHPEMETSAFACDVTTTWCGIYYQKGLGGGKRGPSGEPISYEKLTEDINAPKTRAKGNVPDYAIEAFEEKLEGRRYNLHIAVYSGFDGAWERPRWTLFDQAATYQPVLKQACQEIADLL
jgi:hypothetical protein